MAELFGRDTARGELDDVRDLVAIGADDHSVQVPRVVGKMTEGAERKIAAAAERVEDGALCGSGEGDVRAVEARLRRRGGGGVFAGGVRGHRVSRASAPWPGAGQSSSMAKRWWTCCGAIEAVEACSGEDEGVGLALLPFAEAGVDVAAELDEAEVGTKSEEHGLTARRGGADARAHGQHVQTPEALADEGVAGVGARGDGGEREARVELRGQILERVNGDVDAAGGESVLDLLNEDAFGVEW